jgi:hypothetical protein
VARRVATVVGSVFLSGVLLLSCGNEAPVAGDSVTADSLVLALGKPARLSSKVLSESSVLLEWWDVADETFYNLYENGQFLDRVDENSERYTVTGLEARTTYHFELEACNAGGCGPRASNWVVTADLRPEKPTGLVANLIGGAQVRLQWTVVANVAYNLSYADQAANDISMPYTTGNLEANANYVFFLTACDFRGCSEPAVLAVIALPK